MSNAIHRVEGAAEELGGKIKQSIGRMLGDEQMQADGKATELRGHAKREAAKAIGRVRGNAEQIAGTIENRAGGVLGDQRMRVEGKVTELKGEAREKMNG